jgi:ankyrin repeat protein
MELFILVLMLVVAHLGACFALLGVTRNRIAWRFHLLSLIGVWVAYFAYEIFVVACSPGKCKMRPDLLLIYPYLILVTGLAIRGLRRNSAGDDVSAAVRGAPVSNAPGVPGALDSRASDGTSELMSAAAIGDLRGMDSLLDGSADIEAADERGWTALMFSALRDELDAVELLLRKGADPSRRNNDRLTAGDIARRQGNLEIATLLDSECLRRMR